MDSRSTMKSMSSVVGAFAVLLVLGALNTSTPSAPTIETDRQPTTTEPGTHRYMALIGMQRIPGAVDSRPKQ